MCAIFFLFNIIIQLRSCLGEYPWKYLEQLQELDIKLDGKSLWTFFKNFKLRKFNLGDGIFGGGYLINHKQLLVISNIFS